MKPELHNWNYSGNNNNIIVIYTLQLQCKLLVSVCHLERAYVNSCPPSAAHKRQWTGSLLVQIMACRLFGTQPLGTQPLFNPVLVNSHVGPWKKNLWNFNQNINISFTKMHLKISSAKWRPFCAAGAESRPVSNGMDMMCHSHGSK